MILRLLPVSALSSMGKLQSPFTWDTGGQSILIFSGPSRSTRIGCARSLRSFAVLQDTPDTLVVLAEMPAGLVKISFFGSIGFGRVNDPLLTRDGVLLVASLDDLMATKLKATLDRAEAKDYRDIAELISAGVSLSVGLSAFRQIFNGEPAQVLRAIGYFKDGDLNTLSQADQQLLRSARDGVEVLPDVRLKSRSLARLISYLCREKICGPNERPEASCAA
jgi:hypothetical protein